MILFFLNLYVNDLMHGHIIREQFNIHGFQFCYHKSPIFFHCTLACHFVNYHCSSCYESSQDFQFFKSIYLVLHLTTINGTFNCTCIKDQCFAICIHVNMFEVLLWLPKTIWISNLDLCSLWFQVVVGSLLSNSQFI